MTQLDHVHEPSGTDEVTTWVRSLRASPPSWPPTAVATDELVAGAKVIGVELRAIDVRTGETAELAVFGCQIPVPTELGLQFEVTLHTSQGDVTFGRRDPASRRTFQSTVRGSLGEYASRLHP
ncbi:MAG: hypothetical protein JO023_18745 [Chloroflexi bacterium]|nr:hypothetical protein [Chloroflexota bacterium]